MMYTRKLTVSMRNATLQLLMVTPGESGNVSVSILWTVSVSKFRGCRETSTVTESLTTELESNTTFSVSSYDYTHMHTRAHTHSYE